MEKSRRQARVERRRQEQRRSQIRTMLIIAGAALVVVAILIWPTVAPVGNITIPTGRNHPQADGNTLGNPDAPVVIEEFSDFQCSHCLNFWETSEQNIINEYVSSGQAQFVYHSFGNFLGNESARAAEATYCAGDQDNFWPYHDVVFANYSTGDSGGYSDRQLIAFAEALGMDTDSFESCLTSGTYSQLVQQDQADGQAAGITGTPGFLVNGEVAARGNDPTSLEAAIEAALAAAGE